jgi:hypothetical protein
MQKHYESLPSSNKKEEEKDKKEDKEKKVDDDVKIKKDSSSFTIGLLDSGGNPIISNEYEKLPTIELMYDETLYETFIIDYNESDVGEKEVDDDERSQTSKNTEEKLEENRQVEMMIEDQEEKMKDDQENHPSNSSETTDRA